jgi:hypothetical protein
LAAQYRKVGEFKNNVEKLKLKSGAALFSLDGRLNSRAPTISS